MDKEIEITRSFSQTVQVAPYEPINVFCSMKAKCDESEVETVGRNLLKKCLYQVERDIEQYQERRAEEQAARSTKKAA